MNKSTKTGADEFFVQVRSHFNYLEVDYGLKLTREDNPQIFDNRLILFESDKLRIRVVRDRGSILIDLAPGASVTGMNPEQTTWYGIGSVLALIEHPNILPIYRVNAGQLGTSVAEIAENLRPHMSEIVKLFGAHKVQETLHRLEMLEDKPLRAY